MIRRFGALTALLIGALLPACGNSTPGGFVSTSPSPSSELPTVTEYPITPSNAPQGITAGPDCAVWFTESSSSGATAIGRVSTSGNVTQYPIISFSHPGSITAGSDGALWFTDNVNGIGRITTGGSVSYPATVDAGSITAGPDGALWLVSGGFVVRLTTGGSLTQYPMSGSWSGGPGGMQGITFGPDGALWFPLENVNGVIAIGRMTTGGNFTYYQLPDAAQPHNPAGTIDITTGSDSALWFTLPVSSPSSTSIGRLTTGGSFTFYPVYSKVDSITSGPDGALWITEYSGKVGRLTTNGGLSEYPVPGGGIGGVADTFGGITVGPDKAIWFSLITGSAIGRITDPFTSSSASAVPNCS